MVLSSRCGYIQYSFWVWRAAGWIVFLLEEATQSRVPPMEYQPSRRQHNVSKVASVVGIKKLSVFSIYVNFFEKWNQNLVGVTVNSYGKRGIIQG
jgi:hypothetical protein